MKYIRLFIFQLNVIVVLVLFFDSSIWAQLPAAYTFTGEAAGDFFGASVPYMGDDGDINFYEELLLC